MPYLILAICLTVIATSYFSALNLALVQASRSGLENELDRAFLPVLYRLIWFAFFVLYRCFFANKHTISLSVSLYLAGLPGLSSKSCHESITRRSQKLFQHCSSRTEALRHPPICCSPSEVMFV